jgi:WD40 repeat protein
VSSTQTCRQLVLLTCPAVASKGVTAVTISPDHTYIAVGHASGNIYLYDLKTPIKPARQAPALTIRQLMSGRKEGHLQGSRILHIGFVGKRHTSIVTGDEDGRAFWWSLGKVMGVESNDVVRMLGSYPDREADTVPQPSSPKHPGSAPSSIKSQPSKRPSTLFAVLPLPLGENDHSTDVFSLTALLTPVKIVIVGMKPSANTWFRTMRESKGGDLGPFVGCASWLRPGEVLGSSAVSDPVLAYSWGSDLQFLRVRAVIRQGEDVDSKGKPIDVKAPEFVEGRRYEAPSAIRALQWYNANVSHRFLPR